MIFLLNKDNLELARAEVEALADKKGKLYDNLLVLDTKFDFTRLAYSYQVMEFLFKCKKSDLKNEFERFVWKDVYKNDFCIRSNKIKYEKSFAKYVWNSLDNPKVKLKDSDTEIWIYIIGNEVLVGKLFHKREEKFHERRPDIRPGFFPVSVKPKIARALVNLTGVNKGKLWDPFCGTGGILLEAGLIGLEVIGSDLDERMIKAAKDNFEKYKVKGKIVVADARTAKYDCDAVVCDPPYGRRASLHKTEIETLYKDFLANVYGFVKKVVIMAPSGVKIETEYNKKLVAIDYVHGSLTRNIYILEK